MPEISRFFGIVVRMYFDDHADPHEHVRYGRHEAEVTIETSQFRGSLGPRADRLVAEWLAMHRDELEAMWIRAERHEPLGRIEPLE